ncbi:hypothetical protein GW17_00053766 [Ensete ventricosum]|nr:hypothetical protein GW17_00053766 [Ensete ventricosum]
MAGPRRGLGGGLQATRVLSAGVASGLPIPIRRALFHPSPRGVAASPDMSPSSFSPPVDNLGVISADIPSKEEEPLPYLTPLCNHSPALRPTLRVQSHRLLPRSLARSCGRKSEINHAGAGGIWAELVSNRGFEAGGPNTPSNIDPWSIIGQESFIYVSTDRTSCFPRNEVALRMEVLCDNTGSVICPSDGVGIFNPGYWGMNIEQGKTYKLILYVRSLDSVNISVSLTSSDGLQKLASASIL